MVNDDPHDRPAPEPTDDADGREPPWLRVVGEDVYADWDAIYLDNVESSHAPPPDLSKPVDRDVWTAAATPHRDLGRGRGCDHDHQPMSRSVRCASPRSRSKPTAAATSTWRRTVWRSNLTRSSTRPASAPSPVRRSWIPEGGPRTGAGSSHAVTAHVGPMRLAIRHGPEFATNSLQSRTRETRGEI